MVNPFVATIDLTKSAQIVHDFFNLFSIENLYLGVFWATESKFDVKIWKLKMAGLIWRIKIEKVTSFRWTSVLESFWDRWL